MILIPHFLSLTANTEQNTILTVWNGVVDPYHQFPTLNFAQVNSKDSTLVAREWLHGGICQWSTCVQIFDACMSMLHLYFHAVPNQPIWVRGHRFSLPKHEIRHPIWSGWRYNLNQSRVVLMNSTSVLGRVSRLWTQYKGVSIRSRLNTDRLYQSYCLINYNAPYGPQLTRTSTNCGGKEYYLVTTYLKVVGNKMHANVELMYHPESWHICVCRSKLAWTPRLYPPAVLSVVLLFKHE
jgi:hypothetical protein